MFVVINLDHILRGNDLDTANLNLRHAVMDAISEYQLGPSRDDHTLVNYMKDRFRARLKKITHESEFCDLFNSISLKSTSILNTPYFHYRGRC